MGSFISRGLAAAVLLLAGASGASAAPLLFGLNAYDAATGSHVDSPFGLQCTVFSSSPLISCEYTTDGASWQAAVASSSTCTATPSCADGAALTLNMRATDAEGTGTASAISRTCDTSAPNTGDNAPSAWQAADVTVALSPSDAGSGVNNTKHCKDAANACAPTTVGTSVSVTAAAGSVVSEYVRFRSQDNVLNTEAVKSRLVRIDKQAPSGGSLSYPDGNATSPISVSFVDGSDGAGSGLGSRVIERAEAALTGNHCGAFGAFTAAFSNPASSPVSDAVARKKCYQYRFLVSDAVGNLVTYTSPNIAKVK